MAAGWMTPEEFSDTLIVAMNRNPDLANCLIRDDRSLSPADIVSQSRDFSFLFSYCSTICIVQTAQRNDAMCVNAESSC